jgi:hypothetical protein
MKIPMLAPIFAILFAFSVSSEEMGGATACTTTGIGAGNDAACGGKATTCVTTGIRAGNNAACGGKATTCITTGIGEGNSAACGGGRE